MTTDVLFLIAPSTIVLVLALAYSEKVLPGYGGWQWAVAWTTLVTATILRPTFPTLGLALDGLFEPFVVLGAARFARRPLPRRLVVAALIMVLPATTTLRGVLELSWSIRVPEFPLLPLLLLYAAWIVHESTYRPVLPRICLSLALFTLAAVRATTLLLGHGLHRTDIHLWVAVGMITGIAQIFSLVDLLRDREQVALTLASAKTNAIEAEQRMFTTLVEYAPIGIWYSNSSGNVVLVNRLARKYLGLRQAGHPINCPHDVFLASIRDRCKTPETLEELAATLASEQPDRSLRGSLRLSDGGVDRVFDVIVTPVIAGSGQGLSRMTILTETTAREELVRQLRQSQKMDTVGTLAGGIAHDFNNQLQVILANLEVCQTRELPESVKSLLSAGLNSARHCSQITSDLLTFSRVRIPKRRKLDLAPLLDETESLLRSTFPSSVDIEMAIRDRSLTVKAEATEIQQIVMNLAINARDALAGKGSIRIGVDSLTGERNSNLLLDQKFVCIVVEDDGPGIPLKIRDRIFEPFFTSKGVGEGTGLGLATVHGIVTSLGGKIEVGDSPSGGARFRILLPIAGPPAEESRVLVIDPSPVPFLLKHHLSQS